MAFNAIDWLIAWRHLRSGDDRPAWVRPLLFTSIYLILIGTGLALYASTLSSPPPPVIDGPFGPIQPDMLPTPVEQWYGTFGALTLILGVMSLIFGLLARFFNLLPTVITMSVLLGCMALVVVLSLMSGLEGDLREKILNQKAHIRVSREDGKPFGEYAAMADALSRGEGIAGASPYLEGEIMVRSGLNRQGALLSGIVPSRQTQVSNLPELIEEGQYDYLENPEAIPAADPFGVIDPGTPYRLRHLEEERKKNSKVERVRDDERKDGAPKDDVNVGGAGVGETKTPANKLPKPKSLPSLDELEDEQDEQDEQDGWEDPVDELSDAPGDKAPPSAESPSDKTRSALLGDIPSVSERLGMPPAAAPADDGWEDPVEELDQEPTPDGDDPAEDVDPVLQPFQGEPALAIEGARNPILIGRELSMELGVRLGASVQLITPVGRITPAGQVPGQLAAKVGGVFYSGMYEYDRKNVYAPLPTVQRFLLTGDQVTGVEVKLVDVEAIDDGKAEVERIVAELGRDDLIVEDWRDLNRNLFSAMFLEKVAMFIALLFVVLVASFGILASNLMSVMEKSKEIAILKAMGTSDNGIMRVFVAEGLVVGLLGSFGGIGMGLGLCWALDTYGLPLNENVYYIEKLPVVVNPLEVALVGIAALVIVCMSSIYPALVASRLRPVDALRQGDH